MAILKSREEYKNDILNEVKILLQNEFKKNNSFVSIYLWGSILTDEFNPEKSDIDSIGFVYGSSGSFDEGLVRNSLSKQMPQLKINFIYLSKFNDGQIYSDLAKYIPLECVLYDMPFWLNVVGKVFKKEDFILGRRTIDEVILGSVSNIKDSFFPEIKDSNHAFFAKALAKLCYFIHQKNQPLKVFKYGDLLIDSIPETRNLTEIITRIKKSGWNKGVMKGEINDLMVNFINLQKGLKEIQLDC